MNGYGIIAPNTFGKITGAPEPICEPMDAIAEAVAWATCTSDPHQVHAGLPAGLILGHEVVARLVKVGSMVKDFKVGDIVCVGAVTPDWTWPNCQDNIHQDANGAAQGMNWCVTENGTFAERFRIRQVDCNATYIPKSLTYEHALMASDMVTTGFHGVEMAHVTWGDTVVVMGIGPVGLMSVAGTSIILNMSGTFLTELTGVSTIVGMILIAIITVILVKYRDKLIRYANSIMTIVLLVGFVVISLLVVYLFGPQVKALLSSWYVPEGVSIWSGLWSCCKYAFDSSAFALTMCCVEQPIETHKQSCLLGIFILVLGGLLQAISCFTFLPFVDEVMNDPLPLVHVMNNYLSAAYPWIRTCYYILMLLAIVSSTIPATYMISSRYQSALKFIPALKTDNSRNIVAAILFMVICTLIGALGLTNLANTGLTIVSYIGMPLVVIPLFFIWPQRTRKFRQAEREQAAAEQKS